MPGVSGGSLVLSGAMLAAGFQVEQIADEDNVTRWMINLSGTSATAPPAGIQAQAEGATMTGTLTFGAETCAVTVTFEEDTRHVRPKWSDTNSVYELRQVYTGTAFPLQRGEKIRLRAGTYGRVQGDGFVDQRLRFLTPQGASGVVDVRPVTPYAAFWERPVFDGASATTREMFSQFEEITFVAPLLEDGQDPNSQNCIYFVSACHNVAFRYNRVWGFPSEGSPPNGSGRDQSSAFSLLGNNLEVRFNDVRHCWNFCTATSLGSGLIVSWNDVRYCWNDGFKTNHFEVVCEDNFFTEKMCADPSTSGNGVHPDMFQHLGWTDGVSRGGFIYRRNIVVRGAGRPNWPDGQDLFFDDSTNGSRLLGVLWEDNFYLGTMPNGLFLRNAVDFVARGNASILDPTVGPIVNTNTGANPGGPYPVGNVISAAGSGAVGSGGLLQGNVSNKATTVAGTHLPPPTQTDNVLLDPFASSGPTSYAANFAAPVYGAALNTRDAVKAAFKPKPGSLLDTNDAGPFDTDGNWRSFGAATGLIFSGPTGGPPSVASAPFTVAADGTLDDDVVVTPSDGGAGGTFTPTTVTLTPVNTSRTFTYTPPAGAVTRTISVANDGGLIAPPTLAYIVGEAPITAVTLTAPETLVVGETATITASVNGVAPGNVVVTLAPVAGLTFGGTILIAGGTSSGTTSVTATTAGAKVISGTNNAGLTGPASVNVLVSAPPTPSASVGGLLRLGFIPQAAGT